LQNTKNKSRWMSAVVRLCLGSAAFATSSLTAQAQTYYYYPTSVPVAPSLTAGAPTIYWQGVVGNQIVWYTYAPQSYQTVYTTQNYQTTYTPQYYQTTYQMQIAQTPSNTQVTPTYYTTYDGGSASPTAPAAPATPTAPAAPAVPAASADAAPPAAAVVDAGDPYGFTGWLNATRAGYGLPAVGHDPNLSNWAAMNNDQQAARGMGHFVMGPARRQNAAMGGFSDIGSMWMNSPAHRAALLDPTIRWIGIAGLGAYWTFNAN